MVRAFFLLFHLIQLPQAVRAEDAGIAALFAGKGVTGTMVLRSTSTGVTYRHNDLRASTRFPVASTFKILNSLIGLQAGVVKPATTVFRWDGKAHAFPDWNRDHTLETAFRVSCVWCYQELARRIGEDVYRAYLGRIGFGLLKEPFGLTEFWLDGSLEASAMDQIVLLHRLVRRQLPFDTETYEAVLPIMVVENTPRYTLRAKTGWAARSDPHVGWYVGYVEVPGDTWVFALNIDLRSETDLPLRQVLVKQTLMMKGIVPD